MRTWRIADNQPGGKMYHLCPVSLHFLHRIFDIAAGTPITSGIADKFNFPIPVPAERPLPVPQ